MPDSHAFQAAGLTYRQLDHWTSRGYLLETGYRVGVGPGSKRSWSDEELQIAKRMLKLMAAGLTVEKSAEVARVHGSATAGVGTHQLAEGIWIDLRSDWMS